jgi:ABC-type antimicrobial peptide transport system permease subunit
VFWRAASVSYAKLNDPCPIADKLPNDYQSLLVVVVVVAVMPNDYHMVVVAAVVAVMPIWLRKSAGCKEHKQDKYQILLHVQKVTNAHNDCLCYIALIPESLRLS